MRPADVDLALVYDGFTFNAISWIEALGFCGIGEAKDWLDGGRRIALDGELPVNPHGGQLSEGRTHGFGFIYEAMTQLRDDAGERQVAGARTAVVTSGGGTPSGVLLLRRSRLGALFEGLDVTCGVARAHARRRGRGSAGPAGVIRGRSAVARIPGAAAHTYGIAFTGRFAVSAGVNEPRSSSATGNEISTSNAASPRTRTRHPVASRSQAGSRSSVQYQFAEKRTTSSTAAQPDDGRPLRADGAGFEHSGNDRRGPANRRDLALGGPFVDGAVRSGREHSERGAELAEEVLPRVARRTNRRADRNPSARTAGPASRGATGSRTPRSPPTRRDAASTAARTAARR